jgi:L-rhamnose isomerase
MRYPVFNDSEIKRRYEDAREIYSSLGVDVSAALETLKKIKVSMHCWQGDDVGGFESASGKLTGGIMAGYR